ncbi:hypothetical protein DPMN_085495 [Dreissena polymorpha]|uniref:Uncharacterized protein n=1 Tax=Dreissena polymorpha TaxID=45954 RepID=A0A9D3YGL2_DREPO|nr:hypothetical protein DPMN_085495 [Dreissena polymorpha]
MFLAKTGATGTSTSPCFHSIDGGPHLAPLTGPRTGSSVSNPDSTSPANITRSHS